MGQPAPVPGMDPSRVNTPTELAACLEGLRRRRGLSYEAMEKAARDLPPRPDGRRWEYLAKSTVGEIVTRKRLPTRGKLLTFLAVCEIAGADLPQWVTAWERASTAGGPEAQSAGRLATFTAMQADTELFGREWLVEEFDRLAGSRFAGYLFLEGDAGVGKTAFLTALVRQRHYPAHFIRRGDPRSMEECIRRDLAGQVIDAAGLDGHLGAEPSMTWTPQRFANLLEQAAERLTASHRLVIVIDALDESDPAPESLPLGFPPELPPGVLIVLSHRTGTRFRRPAGSSTLAIGSTDPRNMDDVRRFLEREVAKADIAATLRAAGLAASWFVDQMAQQCRGVWVYMQYVLTEVRLGRRRADDLECLPENLADYYMINIASAEHEPDWHTVRLPVLSTLAAARRPLPAPVIARFAGVIDVSAVQDLCDFTYRPFLSVTGQDERQYAIYHMSLREFLRGHAGDRSDHDSSDRIRSQLRVARRAAHDRFATFLLADLGGLDAGMPGLSSASYTGDADSMEQSYALRHLSAHLEAAGRVDELHRLLTCLAMSSAGEDVNPWVNAHDRAGSLDSYLADLERARRAAEQMTDYELRSHRPAAGVGLEVRYALLAASVRGSNDNVPADLLAQLVDFGIWELGRAVAHAKGLTRPSRRFKSLLRLYHCGSADQQPSVLAAASAAASEIRHDKTRADALAQLAPLLGAAGWPASLAAAGDINDEHQRSVALARLALMLPDDLVEAYLGSAGRLRAPHARYQALTAVAARLDRDRQASAMMDAYAAAMGQADGHAPYALKTMAPLLPDRAHAQALSAIATWEEGSRSFALEALAPFLPDDLLATGLALADRLSDPAASARALTALAPRSIHAGQGVLTRALAAARSIPDPERRVAALGSLADHLPSRQRDAAVAEALEAVRAMIDAPHKTAWDCGYDQERALSQLLPRLPRSLLDSALGIAVGIENYVARERILVKLAPILPRRLMSLALSAASPASGCISPDPLIALGERLPVGLLARAIAAAADFELPHSASTALRQLARHLPENERPPVLEQSLAAARAVSPGAARADALAKLATCLPPELAGAILAEALRAVLAIGDSGTRYRALQALLPYVPLERRQRLVRHALATVRTIQDGSSLARALATLTHYLVADAAPVLQAAYAAVARITDEAEHAVALTAVAVALPTSQRSSVVAEALDAVAGIPDTLWNRAVVVFGYPGSERADALLQLAPLLSGDQLERAQTIAVGIPDRDVRLRALVGLAPYLQADHLTTVTAEVLATDDGFRHKISLSDELARLAPHLPAHLLGTALSAALDVEWDFVRAECIATLAPSLPDELIPRAVEAAQSFADEASRTIALAPLISRIRPRPQAARLAAMLDTAVLARDAGTSFEREAASDKWRTYTQIAGLLPPRLRISAVAAALNSLAEGSVTCSHENALNELARLISATARTKAIDAAIARAAHLGDPARRARSLANLIAVLTPERRISVVRDILNAIAVSNDETAAQVLVDIAPHIPAELVDQAFARAEALTNDWQRTMTLKGLAPVLSDDLRLRGARILLQTDHPAAAGQLVRSQQHGDWPPDTLIALLRTRLRDSDRATIVTLIAEFAPAISRVGGQKACQEIANAINQAHRWWP